MIKGEVAVLTQRMDRSADDIKAVNGRVDTLEKCHSEINVSLAKLPTKEDFVAFMKEYRECRVIDQNRVDTLYTRDAAGTLITAIVGGIGILIASLRK